MVFLSIVTSEELEQDSTQSVQNIIDATNVFEVRLDEVHAGPVRRVGPDMTVRFEAAPPQIGRVDELDRLIVRFTHMVSCDAVDDFEQATKIELSHAVVFELNRELTTTWQSLARWIDANVYFVAYPYIRQSVTSISASLGLPPIVLGYLSRDHRPFAELGLKQPDED